MKSLIRMLFAILAVVSSGGVQAAVSLSPAIAEDLLQKSGLATQLAQIEPSLQLGINVNPDVAGKLTEAQLASLRGAFATAYAQGRLAAEAKQQLATTMSPEVAKDALAWLGSDLGQRIAALEDAAGQFEGVNERAQAAADRFKRLPERRIQRYVQLAKATNAGEGAATVAIDTTLAGARAVASLSSDAPEQSLSKIKADLEANRADMARGLEEQFIVLFAGAYETLQDSELDQYIAFSDSPSGKAYNGALLKVLDTVVSKAGVEAGQILSSQRKAAAAAKTGS